MKARVFSVETSMSIASLAGLIKPLAIFPTLLEQLQHLIFLFKQTENEKDRYLIYLKIDNWLIEQNILFYTAHAVREIYVHQFLVNEGDRYDYKNAWKMPEINN
ncbi:hypothetical protein [Leuconostoc suionicum]|nr:hypothetical protein [Leuconostoc suionicum]BAX69446.1 oligopeptide ABC transporter periplasmic protein [Leuconostoc suionicum]